MAKLVCSRCGATAEGKDFDECDSIIDHSLGLKRNFPCTGNPDNLTFDNGSKTGSSSVSTSDLKGQESKLVETNPRFEITKPKKKTHTKKK